MYEAIMEYWGKGKQVFPALFNIRSNLNSKKNYSWDEEEALKTPLFVLLGCDQTCFEGCFGRGLNLFKPLKR